MLMQVYKMKLIILGSGGCQVIPRPCCQCRVCKEARIKGVPYERLGPATFIEDENILIDTPAEISIELNRANIKDVNNIIYTHWHLDHTEGIRVFEQLNMNWLKEKGVANKTINLYLPEEIYDDIFKLSSKYGSILDYYIKKGLVKVYKMPSNEPTKIGSIKITPIKINTIDKENSYVLIIEKGKKKIVYSICDFKYYPINNKLIQNPDLLIIQWGCFKDIGIINPLLKEELYSDEEVLKICKDIHAKKVIFMHLEESYGRSYDDYKKLESKYKNIKFAYDGMKVEI